MPEHDYGEIICEAVSEIVSKELAGLNYTWIQTCEIMDDSEATNGVYLVKNGQAKFKAFSPVTTYKIGDTVQVITPNNDTTQQRVIISKKATNEQEPITYIAPFNNLMKASDNMIKRSFSRGLTANTDLLETLVWDSGVYQNPVAGYTMLGLSAQFRSWVDAVEGIYGLRLDVYAGDIDEPVTKFYFNNKDMYGNPYNYDGYYTQQKLFDLTQIPAFTRLKLYFYQNKDFKNAIGEMVPSVDFAGHALVPNLYVTTPEIYFGYDINDDMAKGIVLYSTGSTYYNELATTRDIRWRFVRTYKNQKNELVQSMDELPGHTLYLYKYKAGAPIDVFAGADWEPVKDNDDNRLTDFTIYNFSVNHVKSEDKFKAVIVYNNQVMYTSNILTFTNTEDLVEAKIKELIDTFHIWCNDETDGQYYLYNEGNMIIGTASASKVRKLIPKYIDTDGLLLTINDVDRVKWTIPAKNTMIDLYLREDQKLNVLDGIVPEAGANVSKYIESYIQTNYLDDTDKPENEKQFFQYGDYYYVYFLKPAKEDNQAIRYTLKENLIESASNNTIICEVQHSDLAPTANKTLNFYKVASETNIVELTFHDKSMGFSYSELQNKKSKQLDLNFMDARRGIIPRYNSNEKNYDIAWSWYKADKQENFSIPFEINENDGNFYLTYTGNITSALFNSYYILQVQISYLGSTYTTYRGIGVHQDDCELLWGPTYIIYSETGYANYDKSSYEIEWTEEKKSQWEDDDNEDTVAPTVIFKTHSTWDGKQFDIENKPLEDPYKPGIGLSTGKMINRLTLSASSLSNLDALYCVNAHENTSSGRLLWSQPIISITNKIDNITTNDDENITIPINVDNSNSTEPTMIAENTETTSSPVIASTAMSMGKTSKGNLYSGVLMGAVEENGIVENGFYGFQDSRMTFKLSESGDAMIGGWQITSNSLEDSSGKLKLMPSSITATDEEGNIITKPAIILGSLVITENTLLSSDATIDGVNISDSLSYVNQINDLQTERLETIQAALNEHAAAITQNNQDIDLLQKEIDGLSGYKWETIEYVSGFNAPTTVTIKDSNDNDITVITAINPIKTTKRILTKE